MDWDVSQFHFIRPLWLLSILVFIAIWLLMARALKSTHWENYIDQRMLEAMRVSHSRKSKTGRYLLIFAWMIASLAAAGPTWQKQAVPSFKNDRAMVIILDLSVSMLAEDLSPNRLAQAKYKLIDILRTRSDGQTALIAYSGQAYTVSPLTDDPNAIEVLLPALHPSIMPIKGSNTEAAVALASQLLNDTGMASGEILLITDGVSPAAQQTIDNQLESGFQLSILSIGNNEAAPIPTVGGGFLRNSTGEIVLSAPNNTQLKQFANRNGGRFSPIQIDDRDIQYLMQDQFESEQQISFLTGNSNTLYDSWKDMGHWLVLLLLPLAALCFRKGVIYVLPLLFMMPPDANAFEWQDLWSTQDQQAQQLLAENPQTAAEKFKRSDWAGVANYQAKNYQAAAQQFANTDNASSHYNRGNALALSGDFEGAIDAYDKAISQQNNHVDAAHNKAIIEELLKQQEQQQKQQNNQQQSNDSQSQDQQSEQQDNNDSTESQEPSASEEPSANKEPSADKEPSASEESAADKESPEQQETDSDDEQQIMQESVEATPEQLKNSSEQWLRTIPDDPSGLLRRKFEYQTRQRAQQGGGRNTNNSDERY